MAATRSVVLVSLFLTTVNGRFYPLSQTTFSDDDVGSSDYSYSNNFTECLRRGNNVSTCICERADEPNYFNEKVQCECGRGLTVQRQHCLTYDYFNDTGPFEIVVGRCIYEGAVNMAGNITNFISGSTCGYHRNGTLCGECSDGNALAINSFKFECKSDKKCDPLNWLLYFVETLGPLTVFFCIILAFKLRGVSTGHSNVFLLYAQAVSLPINILALERDWMRVLYGTGPHHSFHSRSHARKLSDFLAKAVLQIYGMWNLDILTGIFPPLCTGPNVGRLDIFLLQYVTAVYPLVLITITYILIQLHARNFRPIVVLWKPVYRYLAPFRRTLDSKTSVIDAFATFILLSYTKFVHTSIVLLAPTRLYNVSGQVVGTVLLFDGSKQYFRPPHFYYAIAAIVVLIVFVIPPPLLLLLYPMKRFQRFLDVCRLRNNLLTAFTDAFQGCYKDGLNGTKDCRYFAGLYFIIRVIIFSLYALMTDYNHLYLSIHIIIACVLALHSVFRPYRVDFFNKQDSLLLNLIILITTVALIRNFKLSTDKDSLWFQIFLYVLILLPAVYMMTYISLRLLQVYCKKCICRREDGTAWTSRQQNIITRALSSTGLRLATPVHDTLPDRLMRPGEYLDEEADSN